MYSRKAFNIFQVLYKFQNLINYDSNLIISNVFS